MKINLLQKVILFLTLIAFFACKNDKNVSNTTGWKYNDKKHSGFQVVHDYEQDTPPGMVLIEGGTFTMGRVTEDTYSEWNNYPRRLTVSTFYMDQHEVSNLDWREYVYWMRLMFSASPKLVNRALPDTLVWRDELAYNEPYLEYYFSHVAYQEYPVVGVSWEQAVDYCLWRTDRVNELRMVQAGVIDLPDFKALHKDSATVEKQDSFARKQLFNVDKYLKNSDYKPDKEKSKVKTVFGDARKTNMSDGILLPQYRLPTEAEWEFAAYGIKSEEGMENYDERRIFPWDGSQLRNPTKKHRGKMMANFVRGRGDYMGVAGDLNDKASITAPVSSFWPNDYGLFNMAGNVNEWVMDVYRPMTSENVQEYNPFRGNMYVSPIFNDSISDAGTTRIVKLDSLGRAVKAIEVSKDSISDYVKYDVRNYEDGDAKTSVDANQWKNDIDPDESTKRLYNPDTDAEGMLATHISNTTRVFKGGGWKDRAYWLNPATRRYLEQTKSRSDLGFRCAMSRVGSDKGNQDKK